MEEPLQLTAEEDEEVEAEEGAHKGAIRILAGPGPNKVNWAEEGDPEELIPVQTPPSSFGSSIYPSEEDEDEEDEEEDEVRSRPGSAIGLAKDDEEDDKLKPAPAVSDYSRKGDRYAAELLPILTLNSLVSRQREELGIEPPQVLHKYLRA